jgi:hypothetical protein
LASKSATATEENLNETRKIEQHVTIERKGWDEEREYQES